jgi:TRAP-type C4-dicarboxylate transport system permease small subunit
LGVIVAYDKGAHVSVDLIFQHFGPRVQRICNVITAALICLFGTAILIYGYSYWWLGYSTRWKHFGILDVPTSYTRIALPLCGLFLVFQVLLTLYDELKMLISGRNNGVPR